VIHKPQRIIYEQSWNCTEPRTWRRLYRVHTYSFFLSKLATLPVQSTV